MDRKKHHRRAQVLTSLAVGGGLLLSAILENASGVIVIQIAVSMFWIWAEDIV